MNFNFYIAKRLVSRKHGSSFTKPVINIAIISISLGLAVMLLSISVVTGFQNEIQGKVIGFGSHIQIQKFDDNRSLEAQPISKNVEYIESIKSNAGVKHVQVYAKKAGIIKTDDQIQGVVLKGIDTDFDWSFFKTKMLGGTIVSISPDSLTNNVAISQNLSGKLNLKLNDAFIMYFIQDPPRMRKFKVAGIYETGLKELDEVFVLCDIKHIQKLNNWDSSQVSGFEIAINDFREIDEMANFVYNNIDYDVNAVSIKELYPQIFDWLKLQDMNVIIILSLMILVAAINMVSTLLIIILEKTNLIGILKALGASNYSIRWIFIYNSSYLLIRGLLWGNVFGLAIAFLQERFKIIKLPQESYYVSEVPVEIDFINILLLNFGTIAVCVLIMVIPSYIITKISPVKAIRFN